MKYRYKIVPDTEPCYFIEFLTELPMNNIMLMGNVYFIVEEPPVFTKFLQFFNIIPEYKILREYGHR